MNQTVEVYKANIPLQKGETIQLYLDKLLGAVQQKFGVPRTNEKPGVYTYMRAVFANRLIMEKDVEGPGRGMKLWAVEYSRQDSGDFKFGAPTEVKEQLNFVPVSKALEPEKVELLEQNFWKGLPF